MRTIIASCAAACCATVSASAEFSWTANGLVNASASAYGEPLTNQETVTNWTGGLAQVSSLGFLADASASSRTEITYDGASSIDTVLYASGNAGSAWGTSTAHASFSQYFTLSTDVAVTLNLRLDGNTNLGSALQGSYAYWGATVNGANYGELWSPGHSISLAAGVHQVHFSGVFHLNGGSMSGFGGSYLHAAMSVTPVPAPGVAMALTTALGLFGARGRRRKS